MITTRCWTAGENMAVHIPCPHSLVTHVAGDLFMLIVCSLDIFKGQLSGIAKTKPACEFMSTEKVCISSNCGQWTQDSWLWTWRVCPESAGRFFASWNQKGDGQQLPSCFPARIMQFSLGGEGIPLRRTAGRMSICALWGISGSLSGTPSLIPLIVSNEEWRWGWPC